jgi:tetratricopeptide (TPR) repeat protein
MKILPLVLLVFYLIGSSALGQSDVRSLVNNSEELRRQDKMPEAIGELTKAIGIEPANADLYKRRAELYYGTANKAAAVSDLLKSTELAPANREIVSYAVILLHHYELYTASLDILNAYTSKRKADAEIFYWRSVSKMGLHDWFGAYEDLDAAIDLAPAHASYRAEQAGMLTKIGNPDEAFKRFSELIKMLELKLAESKPRTTLSADLSLVYLKRARLFHAAGDSEAEFDDLARFIEYDPTFSHYQIRAQIYSDHRMYPKAIADLTEAIRLSNHPPIDSLIRRGEVYVLAENYSEAVRDYEQVLKTDGVVNRKLIEQRLSEIKRMSVR